jgi:hypothetical protein
MTHQDFRNQRMKPDSIDSNDDMARGFSGDWERYIGEIIMDPHFFIF